MLLGPIIPTFKPWSSRVFLAPRPMNLYRFSVLIGIFRKENIMNFVLARFFPEKGYR